MHRFSDWKLTSQLNLMVLVVVVVLAGTLMTYSIVTTLRSGREEIELDHARMLEERRNKLWDNVNFAYETMENLRHQAEDPAWLERRYGPDLARAADLAESALRYHMDRARRGEISMFRAQEEAVRLLREMRYGNEDLSFWICDSGTPIPALILYPADTGLEGTRPDAAAFKVVGSGNAGIDVVGSEGVNLFAAARDTADADGTILHHNWPKTGADGKVRSKPMLTHVRTIPEWGWIIGTGMHVDSAVDEARRSSVETLRSMTFDDGLGYFWITDTAYPVPRMVMDAVMPELEGTVLDDPRFEIVGEEGTNLFLEFAELTEIGGSGTLRFDWPKPGPDGLSEPVRKEAFVRPFEAWGWIVGSGIYLDDMEEAARLEEVEIKRQVTHSIIVTLSITLAIILITLVAVRFVIRRITKPINEVVQWSHGLAEGDLTGRLTHIGRNEIGMQGRNLNEAAESIRNLMNRIKGLTGSAEAVKSRLSDSAAETGDAFGKIAGYLDRVQSRFSDMDESIGLSATAVTRIGANIAGLEDQVTRQAASVEESTAAVEEILASLASVARTSDEKSRSIGALTGILEDCRGSFGTMNGSIAGLAEAGEDIGTMATIIDGIASRTNLLSMNAAIEAAHAGDAGRGFAVVADEMRNLATSARSNARSIKESLARDVAEIEHLSRESRHMNEIYMTMETEVKSMADTLTGISDTMAEISTGSREILESVGTLRSISSDVLAGSKQIGEGKDVVSRTIDDVSDVSGEVGQAIGEVMNSTEDISRAISALNGLVNEIVDNITGISREIGRFRT